MAAQMPFAGAFSVLWLRCAPTRPGLRDMRFSTALTYKHSRSLRKKVPDLVPYVCLAGSFSFSPCAQSTDSSPCNAWDQVWTRGSAEHCLSCSYESCEGLCCRGESEPRESHPWTQQTRSDSQLGVLLPALQQAGEWSAPGGEGCGRRRRQQLWLETLTGDLEKKPKVRCVV